MHKLGQRKRFKLIFLTIYLDCKCECVREKKYKIGKAATCIYTVINKTYDVRPYMFIYTLIRK